MHLVISMQKLCHRWALSQIQLFKWRLTQKKNTLRMCYVIWQTRRWWKWDKTNLVQQQQQQSIEILFSFFFVLLLSCHSATLTEICAHELRRIRMNHFFFKKNRPGALSAIVILIQQSKHRGQRRWDTKPRNKIATLVLRSCHVGFNIGYQPANQFLSFYGVLIIC